MGGISRTYYKRKAAGRCAHCGEPIGEGGTTVLCSECRKKQKQTNAKRRHKNTINGGCSQCGKPTLPNAQECEKHYLQGVANNRMGSTRYWNDLKRIWDEQTGKCAYSDEKLVLGVNASLDHIVPISQRPDLKSDVGNVQWVSRRMNVIKNDLTESEMYALFKSVLKKLEQKGINKGEYNGTR